MWGRRCRGGGSATVKPKAATPRHGPHSRLAHVCAGAASALVKPRNPPRVGAKPSHDLITRARRFSLRAACTLPLWIYIDQHQQWAVAVWRVTPSVRVTGRAAASAHLAPRGCVAFRAGGRVKTFVRFPSPTGRDHLSVGNRLSSSRPRGWWVPWCTRARDPGPRPR